ncbi:hypothetical protein ANCCAN_28176 [Ancylostoma caninum]|uniref:Uncharacterized protein n=1 Tax=Ancylostoma caninum TaxID=29170 RepID=A0A368F1X1_ANCCA|nr:hypothetical protein ANCCAN_28176 [Ancylostoma caninum]
MICVVCQTSVLTYQIISIFQLKFENAPFPSITLCNLNPYKKSAINQNPETKAMIDAYSKRISTGDKSEGIAAALASHLHSRGDKFNIFHSIFHCVSIRFKCVVHSTFFPSNIRG